MHLLKAVEGGIAFCALCFIGMWVLSRCSKTEEPEANRKPFKPMRPVKKIELDEYEEFWTRDAK